jgi:hypothetical protein
MRELSMAGVIIDGQVVPTKVVYVGNLFNIWKFEIPEVSYSILLNQGKQLEISVTGQDSENLAADLEMLKQEVISEQDLETKWYSMISDFLECF